MAPLTQLKNISRQKDFKEAWNPVHDRAFYATKEAIANSTILVHPLPKAHTEIWCDASNIVVRDRARTIPTWVVETVKFLE